MKNIFAKLTVLAMTVQLISPIALAQSAQSSTYRNTERTANLHKTNDVGAGVKWGSLSGVNVKYWANEEQAIDATVAFASGRPSLAQPRSTVGFRDGGGSACH